MLTMNQRHDLYVKLCIRKTHIVGAPESAKGAAATAASSSFFSALTHEKVLSKRVDKKTQI